MQLSPQTIRTLCRSSADHAPMITPFIERTVHNRSGLSGGLSCAGYDVHLQNLQTVLDDNHKPRFMMPFRAKMDGGLIVWTIPPQTGVLGVTAEMFTIPKDVVMHYFNKSTLARRFINAAATLAEPGWRGHLTLELYNSTDNPIQLIQGQPIGQVAFMKMDAPSETPYSGKYQDQPDYPVQAIHENA